MRRALISTFALLTLSGCAGLNLHAKNPDLLTKRILATEVRDIAQHGSSVWAVTSLGNALVEFSATGSQIRRIPLPSTPGALAIAPGGQKAFVSLPATRQILPIRLSDGTPETPINLDDLGLQALPNPSLILALAGAPERLLVSFASSPFSAATLVLFENRVPLPDQLTVPSLQTLIPGSTPSTSLGATIELLFRFRLTSTGVSLDQQSAALTVGEIREISGRLFDRGGAVFDSATFQPLGELPLIGVETLAVDAPNARIVALFSERITAFNPQTLQPIGEVTYPDLFIASRKALMPSATTVIALHLDGTLWQISNLRGL